MASPDTESSLPTQGDIQPHQDVPGPQLLSVMKGMGRFQAAARKVRQFVFVAKAVTSIHHEMLIKLREIFEKYPTDRTTEDFEFLLKVSDHFEELSRLEPVLRDRLVNRLELRSFKPGQLVVQSGDPADYHAVLINGTMKIEHTAAPGGSSARRGSMDMGEDGQVLESGHHLGGSDCLEGPDNDDSIWPFNIVSRDTSDILRLDKAAWREVHSTNCEHIDEQAAMLATFEALRHEPLHNLRELSLALEPYGNPKGVRGRCERHEILLKQGERCDHLLLLLGRAQARLLREVVVERERRVVEAGAICSPGLANECCTFKSTDQGDRSLPRSTVLMDQPGEVWTIDKFLFMKRVSKNCIGRLKDVYDNEKSDEELVESYLEHRKWKTFKAQLVESVVNPDLRN